MFGLITWIFYCAVTWEVAVEEYFIVFLMLEERQVQVQRAAVLDKMANGRRTPYYVE
jgi:hypothetical protein